MTDDRSFAHKDINFKSFVAHSHSYPTSDM